MVGRNFDRTVHGLNAAREAEVVRYERAGKWYLEPKDGSRRTPLTLAQAVETAAAGHVLLGRAGGLAFDAKYRRHAAAHRA